MTLFAVVELMGHRTRAGAISDAQLGGATLLRIEHPTRADHSGEEPLTEYYAASAIFSIRPCSQEEATKVAGWSWAEPASRLALSPAAVVEAVLGDDDERVDPQARAGSTPFQGDDAASGPSRERMDGPAALTSSIYVASSWRNHVQPVIVAALRTAGFDVYDFRHPDAADDGFHWSQVYGRSGDAAEWTDGVAAAEMVAGLDHPLAVNGFGLDMDAMERCDTCVLVLPCGRSAHLELGWFVGQGRRTAILLDDPCQPELMYRMVDLATASIDELLRWLGPSSVDLMDQLEASLAAARATLSGTPQPPDPPGEAFGHASPAAPSDDDACPDDPDGQHHVGCGCDHTSPDDEVAVRHA